MNTVTAAELPTSLTVLFDQVIAAGGTVEAVSTQRFRVSAPRRVVGGGTALWKGYVGYMVQSDGRPLVAGAKIVRAWLAR